MAILSVTVLASIVCAARAEAQVQTVTYTAGDSAGISGGARSGCVFNDFWLNPGAASITFEWTDTTNAQVGNVRVEVDFRWGYYRRGNLNMDVEINDVGQPEVLTSPSSQPGTCGLSEVTSSTHEAGIMVWNPLGQNRVTLTLEAGEVAVLSSSGSFMVQIIITRLNEAPNAPTLLNQFGVDGKGIPLGATTPVKAIEVRAMVNDPDGDAVMLEVEIRPTAVFFTGKPNVTSLPVASGSTAAAALVGLADSSYHWQVRAVDPSGERSPWASFGSNSEVAADFKVDTSVPGGAARVDDKDHGSGDCALAASSSPGLPLTLLALIALGACLRLIRFGSSAHGIRFLKWRAIERSSP